MKVITLQLITLICFFSFSGNAQDYSLSQSQTNYSDLVNPTSLTNGLTWDDPQIMIPLGFEFPFFDIVIDTLYIQGDAELIDNIGLGSRALISIYDLDILDRGFDIDGDEGEPGGISPISYQISGNPGNQLLKLEWKNVGFYDEMEENGTSQDFASFQFWLYEATGNMEFHYGPNSLTNYQQILMNDGDDFELNVAFDAYVSDMFGTSPNALGIGGNPSFADFGLWSAVGHLTEPIPEGIIYEITNNNTTSTSNLTEKPNDIRLFPNPVRESFQVETAVGNLDIQSLSILNMNGQLIKKIKDFSRISVNDLEAGCYLVEIQTDEGIQSQKLIKI